MRLPSCFRYPLACRFGSEAGAYAFTSLFFVCIFCGAITAALAASRTVGCPAATSRHPDFPHCLPSSCFPSMTNNVAAAQISVISGIFFSALSIIIHPATSLCLPPALLPSFPPHLPPYLNPPSLPGIRLVPRPWPALLLPVAPGQLVGRSLQRHHPLRPPCRHPQPPPACRQLRLLRCRRHSNHRVVHSLCGADCIPACNSRCSFPSWSFPPSRLRGGLGKVGSHVE